jgi:tetratricopeptide (TPR) repeat protein
MTHDLASEPAPSEADLLARADAASAGGDHDAALGLLSEARARLPHAPRSWLRSAELLIRLRRFDAADALLDEAVSRFPDHFWLARTRALVARGLGDDVEAYTRCRALRQAFPDNPAAHADLAHLLLDLNQVTAAEAEARAGLALFPDLTWLQHMYARCADEAGDIPAAAVRWTDLLTGNPYHEPAYAAAVHALVGAGRLEEAAGIAREGFRLFPDGSAAQAAWAAVGQVAAAEASAAFATAPAVELLTAAVSAERSDRWAQAASAWALLRDRTPALAPAYASGARALLRLGRMAEAEIVLAKARRDVPADAGVLEAWADAAVQRGAFADALLRFRALRQAFPSAPRALVGITRALHDLGRMDEADAAYAELVREQSPDPCLARHRADALAKAGRWAEADAVLSDAVARFPDDLETALRWVMAGQRGPDPQSASSRSDALRQRFPGIAPVIRSQPDR